MRNLIYLFIGWLATATAQSSCPFGTLQVGSTSDGIPICNACVPEAAECNEWFNCEITHDPRCNWLNCTDYVCNSDEVFADLPYNRFCAKAVHPGQYPVCEGSDVFIASSGMCVTYTAPSADGCVEPEHPYTTEDGTVKCMRMYSPQTRSCPLGYSMHHEDSETVCFTVRPAECMNTTFRSESGTASVSPRPSEVPPSDTASVTPRPSEEPPSETASVTPKPSEEPPSETPSVTPRPSQEPPSDSASETPKPSQEPPSDSASVTPKPSQEPPSDSASVTPKPSEEPPSETASVTPKPSDEPPSETASVTPKPSEEPPSETASVTPKPSDEPPSETATATPRVQEKPSETPRPSEEPPSETASATPRVQEKPSETPRPSEEPPSETPSVTPKHQEKPSETPKPSEEPPSETPSVTPRHQEKPSETPKPSEEPPSETATATPHIQEKPSETPKPSNCHCVEPSILVRDVYCLWNEIVEPIIKCNEQDMYIASMNMCAYIIEANEAEGTPPCPEGYRHEIQNENAVCIKYYESTFICPRDFVYIHEQNRLGFRAGCYFITNATCDSTDTSKPSETPSVTPKPQEKPSETPSFTPRPQEKPSETPSTTPKPRPSQTPTRTPRRSSTPTATPKQVEEPSKSSSPSSKPLPPKDICEVDPRNPRCIKPDSILNQFAIDANIAPLPTFKPAAKPFKPMTVVPIPTPWAVPEDIVIPSEDIPPYMPSRMSFTDGNPSQFEEPQKIQEIQASIACTLRMPLEKIRVENITILTLSTGLRETLAIDPSDYMMDSNGTVVCYQIAPTGRLLRVLQNTDIQVDIDYLIVEPSTDILSLNTSQFADILRTSPLIQTFAQSVGSTGIASEVTVASYAGIQVPSTSSISAASSYKFPTYGIGILGGFGGLLVLASVGVGYYIYRKKQIKKQPPVQNSTPVRVRFVDEVDIVEMQSRMPKLLGRQPSARTHFNPLRVANVDITSAV